MPDPAPLPPPLSPPPLPPVSASADCVGPLDPVLTDGKNRFHVEGLIAIGGYGRVALATVEGDYTPVAIKVYCKDKLIVNRSLLETYDLERAIMLGNAKEDCEWLVKLKGTFGDLWNRYLVMVRIDPHVTIRHLNNSFLTLLSIYCIGLLSKLAFEHHFRSCSHTIVRIYCASLG